MSAFFCTRLYIVNCYNNLVSLSALSNQFDTHSCAARDSIFSLCFVWNELTTISFVNSINVKVEQHIFISKRNFWRTIIRKNDDLTVLTDWHLF